MPINLGIAIIFVTVLGFVSNWLNWRFLNYRITRLLYFIGALIHETSHAVVCLLTGAKILEFQVFSRQPHVTHEKSKLPFLGELLIAAAPIAGGLLFLFALNKFFLAGQIILPQFTNWQSLFSDVIKVLTQINILHWQSWIMILLFLNAGAMIGPSFKDLKNAWPLLIVLLFVKWHFLVNIAFLAAILILVNIAIQLILIAVIKILK